MTKDDLPPPPEPDTFVGLNAAWFRTRLDRHALAAIAAHDAKREKIRLWRHGKGTAWHIGDANSELFPRVEFAWAYIEREGA